MDPIRFDHLSRALGAAGSRRAAFRTLAAPALATLTLSARRAAVAQVCPIDDCCRCEKEFGWDPPAQCIMYEGRFMGCCPPENFICGAACCPPGMTCLPPPAGIGEQGHCCPVNTNPCDTVCCEEDTKCCDNGTCCRVDLTCCGGTCCPPDRTCCDDLSCCGADQICNSGQCWTRRNCPPGSDQCGQTCCVAGQRCCASPANASCCSDAESFCCGGICCALDMVCVAPGLCGPQCPTQTIQCGRICCGANEVCQNGTCTTCPAGKLADNRCNQCVDAIPSCPVDPVTCQCLP